MSPARKTYSRSFEDYINAYFEQYKALRTEN